MNNLNGNLNLPCAAQQNNLARAGRDLTGGFINIERNRLDSEGQGKFLP
jgi:hypothetical protein